jgi:hypothetical protein
MRRQDTDSKVRRRIDYLVVMTSIIATTSAVEDAATAAALVYGARRAGR